MNEKEAKEFLKSYSLDKTRYFKPPRDKEVIVQYKAMEKVQNHFQKSEAIPRYHLIVDGHVQYWDRGNKELAAQMCEIPYGSVIAIQAIGEKKETRYQIRIVK